jgi:5-methylphenazine-1-carboxylate 1-monooxygenase
MNQDQAPTIMPSLRLLYRSAVDIDVPLSVGRLAVGERRIINITGGSFTGPRLSGIILPGGADWQIIRSDGITAVEARYTLQTHDGALIYVDNRGLRHGPEAVMARLAAGESVDPRLYYFRTTPVFETGSAAYQWLNGIVAVAVGERHADQVVITVYEVT